MPLSPALHQFSISVRDLHSEDSNASADPFVCIEAFDNKKMTSVKTATLNAVYDETFRFDIKDANREQLEAGSIKISVLDQDLIGSNLIGTFVTDFQAVYFDKSNTHEWYRRWVSFTVL